MDKIKLGTYIKNRRKQLNISIHSLADSIGISFQAVHKWEKGESMPDFIIIGDLCKILKISLNDFIELKKTNELYNERMSFQPQNFGKTLKKYLNYYKYSQKKLSHKTGISQSTISNIINQKSYPSIEQFKILCKVFNISYSDLYFSIFNLTSENNTKKINKRINLKLFLFFLIILLTILIFSSSRKQNIDTNNNNNIETSPFDEHYYVEFWDKNGNLIDAQKIAVGENIKNIENINIYRNWNKKEILKTPTTSTIYKEIPKPPYLELKINNLNQSFYFNSVEDFDKYSLANATHYTSELLLNGNPFDVTNITENYYELDAVLKPIKTRTISFKEELNLEQITIKDTQILYELPIISTSEYIIYQYEADNKIIEINKPFSFEKSIVANPIYHIQETQINGDGYITYLSSNEESIIIPDSIDGMKVNGICANAIKINENNKQLIFLNKNILTFNNVFVNEENIDQIKEIEINYNTFTSNSSLGPITNLDKLHIKCNETLPANGYRIKDISTKDLHLKNLEYYYSSHIFANYQDLNVDTVTCLDKGFTHIMENMFRNSKIKYFNYNKFLYYITIQESAFNNCKNLEKFNFYTKVIVYGDNQFFNCSNLKEVMFWGNINRLSNNMFYNTKIENLTINTNVEKIEKNAFNKTLFTNIEIVNANEIEQLVIPNSLKNFYIGGVYKKIITLNETPNLTIHYLDYNSTFFNALNTTNYNICLNCTCLHKGVYPK